jgi:hypothetical protein
VSVPPVLFDHIALGLPRIADAVDGLAGVLGGVPHSGGPGGGFRWATWQYAGGGVVEVIEPAGRDGFLHRFLAARGPGIHHVTFKVPSLRETCDRAEALGHDVVGRDETDPTWKTAFLHPKRALGIVVQLAESSGGQPRPWAAPPAPPGAPPPVRVRGLRLRAQAAERALRQWQALLDGTVATGDGGTLVIRWPASPLALVVEIEPTAPEGPLGIEYEGAAVLADPVLAPLFRRREGGRAARAVREP